MTWNVGFSKIVGEEEQQIPWYVETYGINKEYWREHKGLVEWINWNFHLDREHERKLLETCYPNLFSKK